MACCKPRPWTVAARAQPTRNKAASDFMVNATKQVSAPAVCAQSCSDHQRGESRYPKLLRNVEIVRYAQIMLFMGLAAVLVAVTRFLT